METQYSVFSFIAMIVPLLIAVSSAKTVIVDNEASLEEYLCPSSGTVEPNTNLVINASSLSVKSQFCLIENTTNLSISASEELINNGINHVFIKCSPGSGGFGFFNVFNLTITSISFDDCSNIIPASAVRYINGTDQFLRYIDTKAALIINHCCNVIFHNLTSRISSETLKDFSIIGVNLCGNSSFTIKDSIIMNNLFYYTDSNMIPKLSMHGWNLHVNPQTYCTYTSYMEKLEQYLENQPNWIQISPINDVVFIMAQQHFNVSLDIRMPEFELFHENYEILPLRSALILFINSITESHVKFQGTPISCCDEKNNLPDAVCAGTQLNIVFYESQSFNGSVDHEIKALDVSDTSFVFHTNHDNTIDNPFTLLQIIKLSGKTSHNIVIRNVSWCLKNKDYIGPKIFAPSPYLFQALMKMPSEAASLSVDMIDIHINFSKHSSDISSGNSHSLINFINVGRVNMSGENFFLAHDGSSVINVVSSNLHVTGTLTIIGGQGFQGGGLKLDEHSILYLVEPLLARFINNTAYQGSAIHAPLLSYASTRDISSIQIVPRQNYTLEKISTMNIGLHFKGNLNRNYNASISLCTPRFNFLFSQISQHILFDRYEWDQDLSQYAYTTLIDSLFKEIDDHDKYISLSNGVCIQLPGQDWNCSYVDSSYSQSKEGHVIPVFKNNRHSYPGQNALFILHKNNEEYSVVSCSESLKFDFEVIPEKYYHFERNKAMLSFTTKNDGEGEFDCFMIIHTNSQIYELSLPLIEIHQHNHCPVGFDLNETKMYCECTVLLKNHSYECDIKNLTLVNPEGYWTGYSTSKKIIFLNKNCPAGYCNITSRHFLLNSNLSDSSCLGNRTGMLCGECKANFSAKFGTMDCSEECNNFYLFFLPLCALIGIVLMIVLFALRLTVALGTINGAIFFANVLGLTMDKLVENHSGKPILDFFRVTISLLNLDLGFPLCFYEGMSPEHKIGFQFVFPVYLWGLIAGIVLLSRCSIRLSRWIANSSMQVLATLFYLSFSKILRVVIDIIRFLDIQELRYHNGSHNENVTTVWMYNGKPYGKEIHGFYLFLAAGFVIFFLLPYTFLVTFSHYCMRFRLINKYKSLIEAYGGPFKKRWRFWFGFRLWITIALFIVNGILQGRDMFISHLVITLLFIIIQALIHPFKNRLTGLIDLFFMINYWLILEFHVAADSEVFIIAYIILLSTAIFVLLLILVFHFFYYIVVKNMTWFTEARIMRFVKYMYVSENENEEANKLLFEAEDKRHQAH